MSLTLSLPFPVSTNRLYRAVKGRSILSVQYRRWKEEAGWLVAAQRQKPIPGPVQVSVALRAPDKRRRDGDNFTKCVFDLLVAHKLIEDDAGSIVRKFNVEWVTEGDPCTVTVEAI
jgi:crossover junction endodeoxyribonuclease RusA